MTVCPKCGFNGQDADTCERCGIIYARMHTVMETRPAALDPALAAQQGRRTSGSMPRLATPSSVPPARPNPVSVDVDLDIDVDVDPSATTAQDMEPFVPSRPSSRSVPAIAQAFPGMKSIPPGQFGEPTPGAGTRAPREVTAVPIVPAVRERSSTVPVLIGLLVMCLIGWVAVTLYERHRASGSVTVEADASANADYFEFQLSELVDQARQTFREVKDLEATKKNRESFGVRVRYLRTRVATSALDDATKQVVTKVLDEVASFLKEDVGTILTALEAEKAKAAADAAEEGGVVEAPVPSPTPVASASPAPSPAPAVKPAIAAPVSRKPSMAALNRATSALASLKTE